MNKLNKLISVKRACILIGVSERTLRDIRARGEIGFVRVAKNGVRFTDEQIQQYINRRSAPATAG